MGHAHFVSTGISEMPLMFVLLIVLLYSTHAVLQSKFYGEVEADQLIYAVVRIPRYARNHEVSIWADSSALNPVALLRYDGLPTMEIYDWKADIPALPGALRLLDRDPTQSVLYIGICGGVALHRYRYFAGSPSTVLVAVEAKVDTCDSEYQHGDNCTFFEAIGGTIGGRATSVALTFGTHSYFAIPVSSNLEGIQVGITCADMRAVLCSNELIVGINGTVVVSMDIYLDQRAEDTNSGRRVQHLNHSSLCSAHSSDSVMGMELTVNRPLAGVWTMEVYIGNNNTNTAPADSFRTRSARRGVLIATTLGSNDPTNIPSIATSARNSVVSVPIQITARPLSCPVGYTLNTEFLFFASSATFNSSLCTAPVASMYSVRTPMIAEGFFALHGEAAVLKVTNKSDSPQPFVVFSSVITPQVQELAVGGGMVLQLQVKLPATEAHMSNEQFAQLMYGVHFQVAVRLGGLPQDPTMYSGTAAGTSGGQSSEEWDVLSGNALLLSTRDGAIIADENVVINQADDDDDCTEVPSCQHRQSFASRIAVLTITQHVVDIVSTATKSVLRYVWIAVSSAGMSGERAPKLSTGSGVQSSTHVRTYSWVITRPSLRDLYSTSLGGNGGASLFLRISHDRTADTAPHFPATAAEKQRSFGVLHAPPAPSSKVLAEEDVAAMSIPELLVSTSLVFEPCPRGSCVHGNCFTQHGDIAAFSCSCRYPWDGESCDTLSVSYWFYVVQIILLVFSNAAMWPAISCCIAENLAFLVALLGLSAGSSAFYHLCDTDVYCIAGLSFRSLQVLDVLFSVSAIASVLLLYAPISRSTHSAVSLLCVGLLVAPVSNLPTSPLNIMQALTFAMTFVVAGWFYVSGGCPRTVCELDISRCFQWYVRTRGDPLLAEESRWKLTHGVHDRVRSGVRGTTSSPIYRDVHTGSLVLDASGDDDVEMTTSSHSLHPQGHQLHPHIQDSTAVDAEANLHDSATATHQSVLYVCLAAVRSRKLRMPLCGLALGSTGLLCFALQGRDNYYFLHSLWHMFMMVSAYLLVQGRVELYR